jgi:hypothetical protein
MNVGATLAVARVLFQIPICQGAYEHNFRHLYRFVFPNSHIFRQGKDVPPSVTVRFWAVRDNEHMISPSVNELERFSQPVLMEQVSFGLLSLIGYPPYL